MGSGAGEELYGALARDEVVVDDAADGDHRQPPVLDLSQLQPAQHTAQQGKPRRRHTVPAAHRCSMRARRIQHGTRTRRARLMAGQACDIRRRRVLPSLVGGLVEAERVEVELARFPRAAAVKARK